MRRKRYFWNEKHHKELDRKMGLSRQMAEPFATLANACGVDTELAGTHGLYPFLTLSSRAFNILKTKPYDVTAGNNHFLQASILTGLN